MPVSAAAMLSSSQDAVSQVLIVEDDPSLREMMRTILESAGFKVLEAGHGAAALEVLSGQSSLPEVIVTDLMMPVMDGQELIRRLRADSRTAAVPILVLSASAKPETSLGEASRPDAVMRKPFLPKDLAGLVKSLESRTLSRGTPE